MTTHNFNLPSNATVAMALSGGLDSTVLLWSLLKAGHRVMTLAVNYGQRHHREVLAAERVAQAAAEHFGAEQYLGHLYVDLSDVAMLTPGSSQTDPAVAVPEGHYADETMRATVVPNRNMMLVSLVAAAGLAHGAEYVAFGAHAGDHAIYPDCREDFVRALRPALQLCHYDGGIELIAPFIHEEKDAIVRLGLDIEAPLHLTWTCYKGLPEGPCGKCGSCVERAEAFSVWAVEDPTLAEVTR